MFFQYLDKMSQQNFFDFVSYIQLYSDTDDDEMPPLIDNDDETPQYDEYSEDDDMSSSDFFFQNTYDQNDFLPNSEYLANYAEIIREMNGEAVKETLKN